MSIRRLLGGRTQPADSHPRLRGVPTRLCGLRAFSLVELLVVLTVIAIAVGITFPLLNVLRQGGRISAATNTVSVAVDAARLLAVTSDKFTITGLPTGQQATYDGTAVIFTPSGECRLVVNDQLAQEPAGDYFELSDLATAHPAYPNRINAYKDVPGRDYIAMPPGTGVAGMVRVPTSPTASELRFLPPPFAVVFDEEGRLVSLDPNVFNGAIFYDRDNTTPDYELRDRTDPAIIPYDPDTWDARINTVAQVGGGAATDINRTRYELPFDQIETVQSIAVYNAEAFENAGLDWANTSPAMRNRIEAFMTAGDDNAEVLFFSRGSGVVIRN